MWECQKINILFFKGVIGIITNEVYCIDTKETSFQNDFINIMKGIININREPLFLCIGTDRATGDALEPLIGSGLYARGFCVYGTLNIPVHAVNLCDTIRHIEKNEHSKEIIAIDAGLGRHIGCISIWQGSIAPGSGISKILPRVGDVALTGTVAHYSSNGSEILHNVRLGMVAAMAEKVVEGIDKIYY